MFSRIFKAILPSKSSVLSPFPQHGAQKGAHCFLRQLVLQLYFQNLKNKIYTRTAAGIKLWSQMLEAPALPSYFDSTNILASRKQNKDNTTVLNSRIRGWCLLSALAELICFSFFLSLVREKLARIIATLLCEK